MKKLWCLFMVMFLMTGCAEKNSADVNEESYFITHSTEDMSVDDGYVIVKEHDFDPITSSQTLCPNIQGVLNVRAHNSSGEVIVCYDDGNQKTFSFADEDGITIDYMTKTHSGSTPCVIRSEHSVYVYDENNADFSIIADDFLFYLENYQDKYYYVNTAHDLGDSDGNIYCQNVAGVRADSNLNNTVVYVDDK